MFKNNYSLSFLLSLGTVAYISLVSLILNNAEQIFGTADRFWGPVMFLSLFVFSALLTSTLMLGFPIWFYFENQKKKALSIFFLELIWLAVLTLIVFLIGFVL